MEGPQRDDRTGRLRILERWNVGCSMTDAVGKHMLTAYPVCAVIAVLMGSLLISAPAAIVIEVLPPKVFLETSFSQDVSPGISEIQTNQGGVIAMNHKVLLLLLTACRLESPADTGGTQALLKVLHRQRLEVTHSCRSTG